ncbi:MAG: helix-turn-helix domain-containing protein [Clostridium sp.]|nr:helix-turn-helix domain-containing protein [Clostridium sp.]
MRKEHIIYNSNIPVKITYASVREYPLHWHNSVEIIYVLKGMVNISIDTDNYSIFENEIEIINTNESHRIHSDEDNLVLIFHIDSSFLEKYYKDIYNIFFYTNTSKEDSQEGEEYLILKKLLAEILCEMVQRQEDYDEEIESIVIKLLFHIINNFHYLISGEGDLSEEQFDRYHRISKYIFSNYNNNITLQDIAKKEFLSPDYLSHDFKNATGYSFTDLLNLTRVEEAMKLLLDSNMSLTEISEEVGFSHTRYLNKHFKNYYHLTPLQFRRKNKVDDKILDKLKNLTEYPLENSISLLSSYLENYERFNYENKLWNIDADMSSSLGDYTEDFREIITLGDAFDLLIEDNKDILEEIQKEINFTYGRLENLFHSDMGVFKHGPFFNWNRSKSVLEFLSYQYIIPLIVLDNTEFTLEDYKNALESFFSYFSDLEYDYLNDIIFQISSSLSEEIEIPLREFIEKELNHSVLDKKFVQNRELNPIYDTSYMIPYIIHKELFTNEDLSFLKAFDVIEKEPRLNNEVFIGASGLVNDMNIRKPSYYAYYLLSKLNGTIISKEDGYIITKNGNEYSILLYNYNPMIDNILKSNYSSNKISLSKASVKKVSLNLRNINMDSKITIYEINEKIGSSYNYWLSMGSPDRLSKEEREILSKASFPKVEFRYSKKSPILNIITKLNGYGATLILITPIVKKAEKN